MNKNFKQKLERKQRRLVRNRAKIVGTDKRPRLSVFRSLKHISAQLIDDTRSVTLVTATDLEIKGKAKTEKAAAVGALLAKKALEKKIESAIFDRGANKYHGRIKALADAAREAGLKF
jgi:large subunit ribosomal protein L18